MTQVDQQPRVALVTGAARGIGAACVELLAAAGWAVMAVDLDGETDPSLTQLGYPLGTANELAAVAGRASPPGVVATKVVDVRRASDLVDAVAETVDRFGRLDAAIGCAGVIGGGVDGWELPIDHERTIVEINLFGIMHLARAAIPALLATPEPRQGRFIAVASAAAARGLPKLAAYSASKAGVSGLVRSLAVELGGTGVTANAVSPGSTETAMLEHSARLYDLDDTSEFASHQAVGRILEPAEVAAVIAFVAGPDSSAITGQTLAADGGLSL